MPAALRSSGALSHCLTTTPRWCAIGAWRRLTTFEEGVGPVRLWSLTAYHLLRVRRQMGALATDAALG
eukprot:669273-Prorocentrum_lima.AAC.1